MADSEGKIIEGLFAADAWQSQLVKSDAGKTIECWQNVFTILDAHPAWRGVIGFDQFAQVPVKRRQAPTGAPAGPWSAEDDYLLGMWLAQQLRITIKALGNLTDGVIACARQHAFHPVLDWLNPLAWDQVPRLHIWMAACLGAEDSPYTAAVGRYFLLNMVRRVFEPGCIMRSVPVLEGAQDTGKSTALRILASDPWFSDSHFDVGGKDVYELIQGVWLYEIGEMAAFNRTEANRVKQFISSIKDGWVPKYVRGRITVYRQVAFSGTTNEGLYLKDWTGNTRMWPVLCGKVQPINLDTLRGMREQLFAEAVALYRQGARAHPTSEEYADLFEPQQAARMVEHPWAEPIHAWLSGYTTPRVTAFEVLREALSVDKSKMTAVMMQDVGRIMSALGWPRKRDSTGTRGWFYERPSPPKPQFEHQDGADPF